MTWSYSTSFATSKDKVRLLIQDTDTNHQLLQDEEIDQLLTLAGSVYLAAAMACETLAAKYARLIDRSAFNVSDSPGRTADSFLALAERLREQAVAGNAEIFFGGRSRSGKEDLADDSDAIQPIFSTGQDDYRPIQHGNRWDEGWED